MTSHHQPMISHKLLVAADRLSRHLNSPFTWPWEDLNLSIRPGGCPTLEAVGRTPVTVGWCIVVMLRGRSWLVITEYSNQEQATNPNHYQSSMISLVFIGSILVNMPIDCPKEATAKPCTWTGKSSWHWPLFIPVHGCKWFSPSSTNQGETAQGRTSLSSKLVIQFGQTSYIAFIMLYDEI